MPESSRGTNQRRILEIIAALLDGDRLDRYEVARRWKIKPQTAHRHLTAICAVLPVRVGTDGRRRVYTLDRHKLEGTPSLAEALAASFGAGFAKVFQGTPYETQLRAIRERLIRRLSAARQEQFRHIGRKLIVLSHHEEILSDRQDLFDEVLDGVLKQRVLRVHYQHFNGSCERIDLKPFSIVISHGRLYVVSPRADGSLHPYRLARFLEVDAAPTTFNYPPPGEYEPELLFRDSMGVFLNLSVEEVRLHISARWASFAQMHRWHPSQMITPLADGSLEMRLLVRICPEFVGWILSLGPEAEVLSPESLRHRVAEVTQRTAALYQGSASKA